MYVITALYLINETCLHQVELGLNYFCQTIESLFTNYDGVQLYFFFSK